MSVATPSAASCPISLQALVDGYTDPHGLYDTLRERDRVSYDPASRSWLVTGHAAVRTILADEAFVSDAALAIPALRRSTPRPFVVEAVQKQIIFADGPKQERVQRALLTELARRSDALVPPLRQVALRLAEAGRARGHIDLAREFAIPFSMEAICMILGVPVEQGAELERLERWSTTYANVTSGYLKDDIQDIVRLGDYLRAQHAARGGTPSDDLMGVFMRDGLLDSDEEVVINCMMVFAAGRVTTQKLLSDGLPLLLPEWGAWRQRVPGNPSAARRLTEELLRVVTPTRYVARYAVRDVTLQEGATIRRGQRVVLFLQAANRDPEPFACPHAMQGDRQPNAHLAFGYGPHRCPGAAVARVEIQVALQALLETLAELRPHPTAAPSWDPNPNIGGYASYPCLCA